jgi:hypothetical protein
MAPSDEKKGWTDADQKAWQAFADTSHLVTTSNYSYVTNASLSTFLGVSKPSDAGAKAKLPNARDIPKPSPPAPKPTENPKQPDSGAKPPETSGSKPPKATKPK